MIQVRAAVVAVFLVLAVTEAAAQRVVGSGCRFPDGSVRYVDGPTCPTFNAPSSGAGTNPMAPALGNAAYGLGFAIGNALRNMGEQNAAEAARQEQARREAQERLEQQAREQAAREAAEQQRRREQMYRNVMNALGIAGAPQGGTPGNSSFDGNNLGLLGIGDTRVVDLRPGPATPFFGQPANGSPFVSYDLNDPNVVDLRHLQDGYTLAATAASMPPGEAPAIMDEALRVSMGEAQPVIKPSPNIKAKPVSEEGLLAFQRANIAYRRERDSRMQLTQIFNEAQERRRLAREIYDRANSETDGRMRDVSARMTLEQKHQMMADIFAAVKAEDEAMERARRILAEANKYEGAARDEAIRVLKAGALGERITPPQHPFPASDDDPLFKRLKDATLHSAEQFEIGVERTVAQLRGLQFPKPTTYQPAHEGLVLGMYTDAKEAALRKAGDNSPFSGRHFDAVASFGANPQNEMRRVTGDHFYRGEVSLATEQARAALQEISGKSYDRLVAHSNGAMITEALIREELIKVKELNILGGDRALGNARVLQNLLDSGKVQRVVVWVNVNDPVPWGTSVLPDLPLDRYSPPMVDHLVKRLTGIAGDARVEYRMVSTPCRPFTFDCHYIDSAYFPEVAKALGTTWSAAAPTRR